MRQEKAAFFALVVTTFLVLSYLFVSENSIEVSGKKRKIPRFLSNIIGYGKDFIPRARAVICTTEPPINRTNGMHWQRCQNTAIYFYSAFFDNRYNYRGIPRPNVRVLGMSEGKIRQELFCLLWKGNVSYSVSAQYNEIWYKNWGEPSDYKYYRSYVISCLVPNEMKHADAVSIISSPCEQPTVYLPLIHSSQNNTKDFVICVKGMNYKKDISLRLIEWIELHLLLGVDVISVYVYSVHPNVEKVLTYYRKKGIVKVKSLSLPGKDTISSQSWHHNVWQKRRNELIPYNDCFYNHIYTHRFVVLLDLDEVIVPVRHYTWQQMLDSVLKEMPNALQIYCSLSAQNVYFFDEFARENNRSIPSYMHILKHVYRSSNFSKLGHAVKSFFSTNNTLAVFNHYALIPLYPKLRRNGLINKMTTRLHHYRAQCPPLMDKECKTNFFKYRQEDTLIWKYATELVNEVQIAIRHLKLNAPDLIKETILN